MINILVTKEEVKKFMSRRKIPDPECKIIFGFYRSGAINDIKGPSYKWRSKMANEKTLRKLIEYARDLKLGTIIEGEFDENEWDGSS